MKVCFVLDHKLMHYRAPFFESLTEFHEVEVVHRGPEIMGKWSFQQKVVKYKKVGPFFYVRYKNRSDIDVLVVMQNLRLIQFWFVLLNKFRKHAFVFWGIGVSSAGGLAKNRNFTSFVRGFFSRYADGLGFYSNYPLSFYGKKVLDKTVVVGNTISSPLAEDTSGCEKNSFLFIGSLTSRKGVDILINSFCKYLKRVNSSSSVRSLVVVGDGPERENLECLVDELGIKEFVRFEGAVNCPKYKKAFFCRAAATFSPSQAGLSVAESFSYGVPFVTCENPISGGEYLAITHGQSGFLFNNVDGLTEVLITLGEDGSERERLGKNAYAFYLENLRMSQFVGQFDFLLKESYGRFQNK